LNRIDKLILVYSILIPVFFTIQRRTFGALVYQLGCSYDLLLSYFCFRIIFHDFDNFVGFLRGLAIILIPLTLFMAYESRTGRNVFSAFGGVPSISDIREGHYRCQAAFRSPITAGTLGTTLTPLIVAFYHFTKQRLLCLIALSSAILIIAFAHSSGPLLAFGAALFGFWFWRYRRFLKQALGMFVISIVILHMIMKAPVWFLMGRVSDIVGGGGWHRAEVIDQAINHFSSWWLFGTAETGDWLPTQLESGGADITNQFVSVGVTAGLLCLILFIYILVLCFKQIGTSMLKAGSTEGLQRGCWCLGVGLFATIVNFFSVSYFDQIQVVWYMLLAIVAATTAWGSSSSNQSEDAFEASDLTPQALNSD
jgi:hypothetical protein